jgi:hypothetical protein
MAVKNRQSRGIRTQDTGRSQTNIKHNTEN